MIPDFSKMMNGPVADIPMNVLCNILADIVYLGYHKCKELKNRKKQEMQEVSNRIQNFLVDYEDTPLDSASFCQYISLPQVSDTLREYAYYIAFGVHTENTKKIKENRVTDYLADNALSHCAGSDRGIDRNLVSEFFTGFFRNCREYYYDKLSINQKTMVYIINERISRLEKAISSSLSRDVKYEPEYTEITDEYGRILRRSNQMCLIYGFAEVKLSQCYVLPDLASMNLYVLGRLHSQELIDIGIMDFPYTNLKWEIMRSPNRRPKVKWNEIFSKNNIVYLVGGAGYGKSLYLQYMINNYEQLNIESVEEYIVLYCDLKSYYGDPSRQPYAIVDFLADSAIENTGLDRRKLNAELIQYYLDMGRCIILFDALDEVPGQYRNKLHNMITSFFVENNQNNKICITSRSRGFIPKQEIEVYEIDSLTEKQINLYLNHMVKLKFFKKEDIPLFLEQAKDLQDKGFLNSFLLLSLLVHIFREEKKLPQTKVDLYKKCFDYMAREREFSKSKYNEKYDWGKVSLLMKDSTFIELACMAAPTNKNIKESDIVERLSGLYEKRFGTYAEAEEMVTRFLEFCAERTELFVLAPEEKMYKFFHRSFFEYFYARYICTNFNTPPKIYKEFRKFDIDTEIYELTVSIIKNDNERLYQELVEYVFEKTEESLAQQKNIEKSVNLLISVLRTVDEKFYKERFVKLFIKSHDLIMAERPNAEVSFQKFFALDKRGVIRDSATLRDIITAGLMNNESLMEEFCGSLAEFCCNRICEILVTISDIDKEKLERDKFEDEEIDMMAMRIVTFGDDIYHCIWDYPLLPRIMADYIRKISPEKKRSMLRGMYGNRLIRSNLVWNYIGKMTEETWERLFQTVKSHDQ